MNITIPRVEISKSIHLYHNQKALEAFKLMCLNNNVKAEITIKAVGSHDEVGWVNIKIDHRTYKHSDTHTDVFASIRKAIDKIYKIWDATYEAGIFSEKQFEESKMKRIEDEYTECK